MLSSTSLALDFWQQQQHPNPHQLRQHRQLWVSPKLGHPAVLLRFPLPIYFSSLLRFHSFVCFALCLGFRLILAHFPIRLQPFAFCRFPFIPFSCSLSRSLPFSLLVFHCSRIRFCWPEPNERMTKTNSPQSELFYGQTICMLVCPRLCLFLCVECATCCVCV